MNQRQMSCSIAVEGAVKGCPARLAVWYDKNEMSFYGELQMDQRGPAGLLEAVNSEMASKFKAYASGLVHASSQRATLSCIHGITALGYGEPGLYFKAAAGRGSAAILFSFSADSNGGNAQVSSLMDAVKKAADFFGMEEFYFFGRVGKGLSPRDLMAEAPGAEAFPAQIDRCSLLTYSHLKLNGDSVFEKALRELFGLKEAQLFLGAGEDGFLCMAAIPASKNSFMESRNMCLAVELRSRALSLALQGSFRFAFVPDMEFHVNCGISRTRFMVEAFGEVREPIPLAGPFSIGDTCLAVGFDRGPSFAMFANLYIREIHLFGAVMLTVAGSVPKLDLLSAAVSDLSIPILVRNLLGCSFDGLDSIDFIRILGLPFQDMQAFDREMVKRADGARLAEAFNQRIHDNSLVLERDQVKASPFGDGVDLVDQRRMRHYYIDGSGGIKLTAQFYYADVNTRLGSYTVERGIFVCGVIEIFKVRFEVLFSFREGDGVLAYGRIPEVNLGFLKLGPSQAGQESGEALPVPADSVLRQFMGKEQRGIVFFLSAGKKDVTFYLDGRIELLSILYFETRIIFCKGLISIDVRFNWLAIFDVSIHLKVNYQDFNRGGFEFRLVIDTSKLAEKLKAVQESINRAIDRLRDKIKNATREIDRAQAHVNELYGQIDSLNRKIEDCKRSIRNAKWWKKAFVAIAKGIEIGAYEVAKAGIYVAIGVATAALQVAKAAVQLAGKVGEGVMKAVNAVIQGALSFFYINRLELYGKANMSEQEFRASIEFVALGKTYRYETKMGHSALKSDAAGAVSGNMNGQMKNYLDHIEDGAFRSNFRRYSHETYTIEEQCRRLAGAREQMKSSTRLMRSMQEAYIREFSEPMSDFDQMNQEYMNALDCVGGILSTGEQAGDVKALSGSMGGLKRKITLKEKEGVFRDEELSELKDVIRNYDQAKLLYDEVKKSMSAVESQRKQMLVYAELQKQKTGEQKQKKALSAAEGSMERVLNKTEEAMYRSFPVDRSGKNYINLSREGLIHQYMDEARQEFGARTSENVRVMRNRSRKGRYDSRL